jgi:di- and tripeptidase
VNIGHCAKWWLAKKNQSPGYRAAERAILREWGQMPIYIREGGSIPPIPFLEEYFGADVVHIPMGQVMRSCTCLNFEWTMVHDDG